MATSLRKRNKDGVLGILSHTNNNEDRKRAQSKSLNGFVIFATLAGVYLAVWLVVQMRVSQFPSPADPTKANVWDFVETRARKYLNEITSFGPRIAGSDSNKASADYIFGEISKIKAAANKLHTIELDVQTVSGSFILDLESIGVGSYPSVYQNQKNIVARIGPATLTYSLLVNCHFDTVVDSPGASDDAVSCAVMLEVLRALSRQTEELPHNIIFLFNGAEENILQTSHGFITQHKWASSIKAFVNLESAGAGGWELLFQTGPDHPWLIQTYINSVPYPHSTVMGQEIFQSGLVPSDTDFRIFRDYGKIPGLDLAHIRNGYVYHTKNDLPEFVEPGCLQRTGDNILALVRALVDSPYFIDPGVYRHGSLVFYDFLGFFVVAYPQRMAVLLNTLVVVVVVAMATKKALGDSHKTKTYLLYLMAALGGVAITKVTLLGVAVAMALFMTSIGRDMSYFTHDYNTMFIFVVPAVAVTLGIHHFMKQSVFKNWKTLDVADLYFEANLLLWSAVVAVLTYLGIMSAFVPLLFVVCPLLAFFVARAMMLPLENKTVYCIVTIIGTLVPQIYITYLGLTLNTFFIPIMGRVGTEEKPDIVVAVMTMLPIAVVIPFQLGMVYLSEGMDRVVKWLLALGFIGVLVVIFTPLGFPYSSSSDWVSKQRILAVHSDRQVHSATGEVTKREASIWLKPLDHHGLGLMLKEAPELFVNARSVDCDGVYCGRPYFYPILSRVDAKKTLDLPAPQLSIPRVNVSVSRVQESAEIRRLDFRVTGPDHVTIFIFPLPGVHVVSWSFGHQEPVTVNTTPELEATGRETHFIYYSYGERPSEPWSFSISFYTPSSLEQSSPVTDMSFAGHYLHGDRQYTSTLTDFVRNMPKWTTCVGWSATLDVFKF